MNHLIHLNPDDGTTLTPILPEKPVGSAFVICPGGGYQMLARHEGEHVGFWLASLGIRAFVLKYRTAPFCRWPAPLVDVLAAVRSVRAHADEYGLKLTKVGVIGFSAGGHVAALASTRFEDADPVSDTADRYSSRPDAAVLAYPVVTMQGDFVHRGSQRNLLGEDPTQDQMDQSSVERHVSRRTPPTFLFHTVNDAAVPVENSLMYAQALRKAAVPFEMHLYEAGPHGVGLASGDHADPVLCSWTDRLKDWLKRQGFLGY